MKKMLLRLAITVMISLALISSFGCSKLRAKDRLNEGTRAYNKGNYVLATQLFKEAIEFNPDFPIARLYYAASLRAQYAPGGDSIENKTLAENAIKAYKEVIRISTRPQDVDAAHAFIAELYKGLDQKEENRNWVLKRINLPKQTDEVRAQSYYTLAVGYWEDSYKITQKYLIPRTQPPQYKPVKEWQAGDEEQVKSLVLKGLGYMEDSLKINPKYANCYSYRGLLFREQIKIETDPKSIKEYQEKAAKDIEEFQKLNRDAAAAQPAG
jgi:tetratricopeptide (TPR) repeat protein